MSESTRARRHAGLALALAMLVAGPANRAHAESLEAIPLQYRLAEELLPILQPLLPADAALTGTGDVLLLRADEATVQQVRAAIATLDRPPRQLLITVAQATTGSDAGAGVRGSATIEAGDVRVGVNRPPAPQSGARVIVQAGREQVELHEVSSVRALEGREAYVALTMSRPFTSTSTVHHGPDHGTEVHTLGRQDAQTGFVATPRLHGEQVTLEISPSQQRFAPSRRDASLMTRSLVSTVTGRLGEWIELGGVTTTETDTAQGLIVWGARSELTRYSAWVKVEEDR
jgi:type II secretory pathway component GspD/PulD (secretin)